ncbi:MAG: Rrf2 family transcriptional regulator [Magnetococcales bacterium]|nr:Rrf2 family transcriptional regulator [Magnetococcales bacterium]
MRLTTRGRYAVTAMLDLAVFGAHGPVSLTDISRRQGISLSYLEQLFAKLRRQGLVGSVRGPGGGYELTREHSGITVADIIRAVDEPIRSTSCNDENPEGCLNSSRCMTHDLWVSLDQHIFAYLESVNLRHLVEAMSSRPDAAGEG